jgi:hypothetical protein
MKHLTVMLESRPKRNENFRRSSQKSVQLLVEILSITTN